MLDKHKCVLVVDDIQPARETVLNILRVLGYKKLIEAADGMDALQKLENNPDIALIISDWKMPRMNGADFLRRVRSRSDWEGLPFLFLTSKSEAEDVAEASDLGVTEYMVKPLTIDVLVEKLKGMDAMTPAKKLAAVLQEVKEFCSRSEFEKAVESLSVARKELPSLESRILFEMANVFFKAGDFGMTKEMLDKSIKINPLLGKAWHLKSELEKRQNEWDNARISLSKALEINPRNIDYLLSLGDAYLNSQDFSKARENFQKAVNTAPDEQWIKQAIWNCYLKRDHIDEVEKDFGPLIIDYLNPDTLNNYAVALRQKGELGRAVDIYTIALKKNPDNPKLLFNAALADYFKGDVGKAKKRLGRVLEENPGFEQARKFLLKLQKEV